MRNRMAVVGRGHEVMSRYAALLLAVLCATAAPGVVSTAAAQGGASDQEKWEVPRTPDGHPDLQGDWTNMTLTPFEREEGKGPVFTWAEVEEMEQPSGECPANPGTVACGREDNQGDGSLSNERRLSGAEYSEVYWDRGSRGSDRRWRAQNLSGHASGEWAPAGPHAGGRAADPGVPGLQGPIWPIRPPGAETTRRTLHH